MGKERARLESIVLTIEKLQSGVQEAEELLFLASEEKDEELYEAATSDLKKFEDSLESLRGEL